MNQKKSSKRKKKYWVRKSGTRSIYNSIDTLPLYLWIQIRETNDLSKLVVSGRFSESQISNAWLKINTEFVRLIGLNKDFIKNLNNQKMYVKFYNKYLTTGNRTWLNQCLIYEQMINDYEGIERESVNEYKNIASVRKILNMDIDPVKTTVRMYYEFAKMANDEAKRLEAQHAKQK